MVIFLENQKRNKQNFYFLFQKKVMKTAHLYIYVCYVASHKYYF